jgi:hypothetical protein
MRGYIAVLCILALSGTDILAQAGHQAGKKQQLVIEPSDSSLLLVASQPNCPLIIENPRRLLNVNLSWDARYEYQLRNRATKVISDFTLVAWTSFGTGGTLTPRWKLSNELLKPGQTIATSGVGREDEIVPLTDELRDRLKLRGPMKAIIVLMVEKVEFSDGSVYNDEGTSKSLLHYFESLDLKSNSSNSNPN